MLEQLTAEHGGKTVEITEGTRAGERSEIQSFAYKASGEDLNRVLINLTDGSWVWADMTRVVS